MTATVHIAVLQPNHRHDIETIVRATGVFSEEEVSVALELFDEAVLGSRPARSASGEFSSAQECHGTLADLRFSANADEPDYEFVGAFEDDRLIGYACFGLTPAADRTYDLYWIAVHPDAQRSGAGAVLMSEVERRLAARHARLVVVETSSREDYEATRRFYDKRGYAEGARLRDFYAPGDDRLVLTKRLAAPAPASAGQ